MERLRRLAPLLVVFGLAALAPARLLLGQPTRVSRVPSADGTLIALECVGSDSGPTLVIAHGGIGDRSRWTPMFPLLSPRLSVCAMDRRGHGASGDAPDYSLRKEAEDIAAVVESRGGPVFLLGHSYGGVAALEATLLTKRISKLILYEPPLQDRTELAVIDRIEGMIRRGDREGAVATFLREVVMVPPAELTATRSGPGWPRLVASIGSHPRQMRALAAYRFDAKRMRTVNVPTLLIRGSETTTPDILRSMDSLKVSLPNWTEVLLAGQQHNAMDTGREQLARAITDFLTPMPKDTPPHR